MILLTVLFFLTGVFAKLPHATLAAVVIVACLDLVDIPALRRLYLVSMMEFTVAMASLLGVLVVGMLWGIFIGITLSPLLTIGRISNPHTETLGRMQGTNQYVPIDRHPKAEVVPGVFVYRVDAQLFYANASRVREDLMGRLNALDRPVDLVVFDLSSSPTIDLSAAETLAELHVRLRHAMSSYDSRARTRKSSNSSSRLV